MALGGILGPSFGDHDVDDLVDEIGPKYLAFFAQLATDMLLPCPRGHVAVFTPYAGVVLDGLGARMPDAGVVAFAPSEPVARVVRKQPLSPSLRVDVEVLRKLPTDLGEAHFSHALLVHPVAAHADRLRLLAEMVRLLEPGGQAVVALPLRGSYPELIDMLREYALKHDAAALAQAVELAVHARPTPETLAEELEAVGLCEVEVDVQLLGVPFPNGRAFATHALFRHFLAADLAVSLGLVPEITASAIEYAGVALARYWSEGQLDLTVNIGCAVGRRS